MGIRLRKAMFFHKPLLLFVCMAVELYATAADPALFVDLLSSQLSGNQVLYTFEGGGSYSLQPGPLCPNGTFSLDQSSGELRAATTVDFPLEDLQPDCLRTSLGHAPVIRTFYCFVIVSVSRGVPVVINILADLPNTTLAFPSSFYTGTVVEGAANNSVAGLSRVRPFSLPVDGLAVPQYRVIGSAASSFSVTSQQTGCHSSPIILSSVPLDREQQSYYELTLEAYTDSASSHTTIGIRVLDVNDHPTAFVDPIDSMSVSEGVPPGTEVARFLATDMDSGLNAQIWYSLKSHSSYFSINPSTGSLYVFSPLDSENGAAVLSLNAANPSYAPSSSETTISIFIDDINELPPIIHVLGGGQPSVSERGAAGDPVVSVEVSDGDSPNVALTLTSWDCSDCFQVSSPTVTGSGTWRFDITLTSSASLDYEMYPNGYVISLTASDGGSPPLSSSRDVTITVVDVNEPPSFLQTDYLASITEGLPVGSEVIRITALDPDTLTANGVLTYSLTSSDPNADWFRIDEALGVIVTDEIIDYENATSVQLTVTASDHSESTMATLTVSISDLNDNLPAFSMSEYSITVSEGLSPEASIFDFSTVDLDSGCNRAVTYSIVFAEPDVFRVDPVSGLLYPLTQSSLDYEAFRTARVAVRGTNLGEGPPVAFSDTTLLITLTDINDAHPVLDPIPCSCWVREGSATDTCQPLSAHDPDSDDISYAISSGNEEGKFLINDATGRVSVISALQYEERSQYSLQVVATDGTHDSEPHGLTILVIDDNDSSPTYAGPISLAVAQDVETGSLVGTVAAQHTDAGYNALTSHTFADGTPASVTSQFRLDPLSGNLYTAVSPLSVTTHSFQVTAVGLAPSSGQDEGQVTVTVTGFVNNPPVFATADEQLAVPENLPMGDEIFQFAATDMDSGSSGELVYTATQGSPFFELSDSGRLTLAQDLEGMADSEFTLVVMATDGGSPSMAAFQELVLRVYPETITVATINDPLIHNSGVGVRHSMGSLEEGSDDSILVASLPPTEGTRDITYTILEEEFRTMFRVAGNEVSTESGFGSQFHRSLAETLHLTLRAQYDSNFHYASLSIIIVDINDHAPQFSQGLYTVDVYRGTPIGSFILQVEAMDEDVGSNAETTYSIVLPAPSTFTIDPNLGIISVSGFISTQTGSQLTIRAQDKADPSKSGSTTVEINILQTSNSLPTFTNLPSTAITFPETTDVGDILYTVTIDDPDPNTHGDNSFCIYSGNEYDLFTVNALGQLTVANPLDFESYPSIFQLEIAAFDSSPNPQFRTAFITVNITDENDEPPTFQATAYEATVAEGEPQGTHVLTVQATDRDTGPPGKVSYSIDGTDGRFTIDDVTGAITTTASPINREASASFLLTVTATDQAPDQGLRLSSSVPVRVTVLDKNDNRPIFITGTASQQVPEGTAVGAGVYQLAAEDTDEGINAMITYSFVGGNEDHTFSLDPWTGEVVLASSLDYETGPRNFMLSFTATDLGSPPLSAISPITVTFVVEDINDHTPLFSQPDYSCSVLEGTVVFDPPCQVDATDADSSDNSIQYSIVAGDEGAAFAVDQTGSLLVQRVLDRETQANYILKVQAEDSGAPRRSSTALVLISILDNDDQIPIFDPFSAPLPEDLRNGLETISVPETLPQNSLLFFAHAMDLDSDISSYSLTTESAIFALEPTTGAVFLTGELDYETIRSHPLTVRAVSSTGTANTHQYTIAVLDINENIYPPEFPPDNPLTAAISRTAPLSAHVATLTATDREGEAVRYYITGGTGYGYFMIDPWQGNVSTSYPLGGVESDDLTLEVTVVDGSTTPLNSIHHLLVLLEGGPLPEPEFISPMFFATAQEGFGPDTVGSVVALVQALVNGHVDNSISYSIASGNDGGKFAINASSGAVLVSSGLDRELEPLYTLEVLATASGGEGMAAALLVIEVADANDFRPDFNPVFSNFTVSVFESHPVGPDSPCVRVFAVDEDSGANSALSYSLESQNVPFAISPDTGDVYLTQTLDRATSASYVVMVMATDKAEPPLFPLSSSTVINIQVIEGSPSSSTLAPVFQSAGLNPSVPEDTPPGTLVETVSAVDQDSTDLFYSLINPPLEFAILPNSGQIYLTKQLDREVQSSYLLLVEVTDGANPSATAFPVTVTVTDVNDERPLFQTDYSFTVMEHESEPTVIGTVSAQDRDENANINSEVSFSIVGTSPSASRSLFLLSSDGVLRVAGDFDRETQPLLTLTIAAFDGGSPSLTSYVKVTVTVVDTNDHMPSFPFQFPTISIPEDTAINSTLFRLTTFDPDTAANTDQGFTISPSDAPFQVTAGDVVLSSSLSARQQSTYTLNITTFDPSSPSVTSELSVEVCVLEAEGAGPVLANPGPVSITENLPPYTAVTRISVSPTRPVSFSIEEGNDQGHFFIETYTGIVRTAIVLDREATPSYSLVVRGSYLLGGSTSLTVTVSVADENDNAPTFSSPHITFSIPEGTSPFLSLGVSDGDSGINSRVSSFFIPDTAAAQHFSVGGQGNLTVQGLDREEGFERISFQVYAIDSGVPPLLSRVDITVIVEDSNDNFPQFSEDEYRFIVSIPVLLAVPLFSVTAQDVDQGIFGAISYDIIGGTGQEEFDIDSLSGAISVRNNYHLEETYVLEVSATDGGGKLTSVEVMISVQECGFQDLQLQPRLVTMEILENTTVSSPIFQPTVLRFGHAAQLEFYLAQPNILFNLDSGTGELTIAQNLDRETTAAHRIVIQAQDQTDPSRIAQTDVEIIVTDINDNRPQFFGTPYVWSVSNDIAPNSSLQRVVAEDADSGSNGEIIFSLVDDPSGSFDVDPNSGVVTVTMEISAIELGSTVVLQIEARDKGSPPLSSLVSVAINIVDSNAPQFSSPLYTASINESAPRGTTVAVVMATGAELIYSITTAEPQFPFNIYQGQVTVNDFGLDYEARKLYQIELVVTDGMNGLTGQARLDVTVLDINDEAPQFPLGGVYFVSINETSEVGTAIVQVMATDEDSAPNAELSYRLQDGEGIFRIDEMSGLISTTGEIDYETDTQFAITVLAVDSGSPPLTGDALVTVAVVNLNDNPPRFTQPTFFGFLRQGTQPGDDVATVTATDADNDDLMYSIVGGEGAENFMVDSTGIVTLLNANIQQLVYVLNISVSDGASLAFASAEIEVEHSNEHSPVFNMSTYEASVLENSPADTFVIQVFATDDDQGTNADISYSLSVLSFQTDPPLKINANTGVITTTTEAADREMRETLTVVLFATDGGGRAGTAEAVVRLLDENDNAPVFTQDAYFTTIVDSLVGPALTVSATDADSGDNADIRFSIDPSATANPSFPFQIGENSGVISVAVALVPGTHVFSVMASDSGNSSLTSETPATVTVIIVDDSTDNPPIFDRDDYNVTIPEGFYFPMDVLTVSASTPACEDDSILYTLASSPPQFVINNALEGTVSFVGGQLDREVADSYTLIIQADCQPTGGGGDLFGFVGVAIFIADVNEQPRFSTLRYSGSIAENLIANSPVAPTADSESDAISAADEDEGTNGEVLYRLTALNGAPFHILMTGVILTTEPLDREAADSYQFTVQAYDLGTPSLNSSNVLVVRVTVTDVNDSPPEFNQSVYHIELAEDSQPGTKVFAARGLVSDNDTAENAVFTFSVAPSSSFIMNMTTGVLVLGTELDRESTPSYTLELIARDGVNTGSAQLIINVTDVNDQPPIFNSSTYDITLPENYPTNITFLRVFALDMDEGINGDVTYSILNTGQLSQQLSIDPLSGEVGFLVSPDYDVNQRIELQVQASDIGGLADLAALIIILLDENDNHPQFSTEGGYSGEVHENRNAGANVVLVDAPDRDSGSNGAVTYALRGSSASSFSINNRTGVVTSSVTFDREINSSFELIVVATDGGIPQLSTNTTLTVTILDENDNSPQFTANVYTERISEFEMPPHSFLTITAEDRDDGLNAEVFYRLSGENSDHFFLTEHPNGSVTLSLMRRLNHEAIESYNLTVRALDRGFPAMEGVATVLVDVIDENDNPPIFSLPEYSVVLAEDAVLGAMVVTVEASDLDQSDNLLYDIDDPQFSINGSSGVITLAQRLDFESRMTHQFTVIVRDQTDQPMSTSATVEVAVTDVNDNPPCFTNLGNETIQVLENSAPRAIRNIVVLDEDIVTMEELITIQIQSGNEAGTFDISAAGAGEALFSLVESPDREEISQYDLVITANDNGEPDLTCTVHVTVVIEDENDNRPIAGHQDVYVYVREGEGGQLQGAILGTVFVNDPDVVNSYTFQFQSGVENFQVSQDGTITVEQVPSPGSYELEVFITDPPHSATSTVGVQWVELSQEALDSSFSMQLVDISAQDFVVDKLTEFLGTLRDIFSAEVGPLAGVHLFSIQDSDSNPGRLDLAITVELSDKSFVSPDLLQHLLHLNRTDLQNDLQVSIHTEQVDLCAQDECPMGLSCSNPRSFTTSDQSHGSTFSVVYLGLSREQERTCTAPSSLCASLTSCVGASYCVEEVAGSAVCYDDCSPSPCRNGGTCVAQNPGYYCSCPNGFDGQNCEQTGGSFSGDSYILFPGLTHRPNGSISLEFSTAMRNGLLFYVGRFDRDTNDFLILEVTDGLISARANFGGVFTVTSVMELKSLNDERWHSVTVQYSATDVRVIVRTLTPYEREEGTGTLSGPFHSLDLGAPLIIGGLPPELNMNYNYQQQGPFLSFIGCVRNVEVNGRMLDFSSPLLQSNVAAGCGGRCSPNPCSNNGRCVEALDRESPLCSCSADYQGTKCDEMSVASTFTGEGYIQYELQSSLLSTVRRQNQNALELGTGQDIISFGFVTQDGSASATLFHIGGSEELGEFLTVEINDGYLQLRYNLGSGAVVTQIETIKVGASKSHSVSVTRIGRRAELVMDNRFVARATSPEEEESLDFKADDIFVGGLPQRPEKGFSGCIRGVKIGYRDLPNKEGEGNEYFSAHPTGEVGAVCTLDLPSRGAVPALYVYIVIGVGVVILVVIATLFVIMCRCLQEYSRGKRSRTLTINRDGGHERHSPSSLAWKPMGSISRGGIGSRSRSPRSQDEESDDFVLHQVGDGREDFSFRSSSPSHTAPTVSETNLIEPPVEWAGPAQLSPREPTPDQVFQDQLSLQMSNPGYIQDSPERGNTDNAPQEGAAPPRPSLTRSPSGHQSIATELSEALSLEDDIEVSKFIYKRVEEADFQVEELNFDQMKIFKEEGVFEPLGSLGSLYDIIIEADHSTFLEDSKENTPTSPPIHPPTSPPIRFPISPPIHPPPPPPIQHPTSPPVHSQSMASQQPSLPVLKSERSQKRSVPPVKTKPRYRLQPTSPPVYSQLQTYVHSRASSQRAPKDQSQVQLIPAPNSLSPHHSRDTSHDSSVYAGDYSKKLDNLLDRFHKLSDLSSQDPEGTRLV